MNVAAATRHLPPASSGIFPESKRIETVLPPVIGHRGAAAYAPENTLAGLRQAKALGCRWVEFDVRLTADSQPILLHDNRLERTTNGRGRVSALPLAAVRRYDAGQWFHSSFAGERVPTLEQALMLLVELGLGANVELKAARDRAPHIRRGILFRRIPKNWHNVAAGLGCVTIHADQQRLRPAMLSEIRRAGYPLLAYTVNDPERAKVLFDFGVKSVFSDFPDRLQGAAAIGGFGREIAADPASAATPR